MIHYPSFATELYYTTLTIAPFLYLLAAELRL